MSRFCEDLDLVPVGTPPNTYGGLITMLRVAGKPESVKRPAIYKWLEENEPSSNLRNFLRDRGYDV